MLYFRGYPSSMSAFVGDGGTTLWMVEKCDFSLPDSPAQLWLCDVAFSLHHVFIYSIELTNSNQPQKAFSTEMRKHK